MCGSLSETRHMPNHRDTLRQDAKFRVLRLLQENPELSQRELARAVGVSTGSIHYVLSALLDKGVIKFDNFSKAEDRRRYAYVLTAKGMAERARLTRAFLTRKKQEYEALRSEIEAVQKDLASEETRAEASRKSR